VIFGFIGTVGSGKTLSMTVEAFKYYNKGMKIFSNYGLSFPHEKLTKKRFDTLIEEKEQLQNCVILLDEIHIWLDSRSSMSKKNKTVTYFLLQTRKRNVRLLFTTQHFHQIDKRLRDTTDVICYCTNVTNKSSLVTTDASFILQEFFFQYSKKRPRKKIIPGHKYYCLYDTTEIVDFLNDE